MAATTVKKKGDMQSNVFEGISAVFAVKDGFTFSNGTGNDTGKKVLSLASDAALLEFPCSEDSGFSFDTGAPSIEHFKVHGLNADWVSTFTPGDTELNLEIPCHDTSIMQFCFGTTGVDMKISLPTNPAALKDTNASGVFEGKAFGPSQKSIECGLLILDDTEKRLFFVTKAKLTAQVTFDGSNKPLCVVLSGSLSETGETSFGILDLQTAGG